MADVKVKSDDNQEIFDDQENGNESEVEELEEKKIVEKSKKKNAGSKGKQPPAKKTKVDQGEDKKEKVAKSKKPATKGKAKATEQNEEESSENDEENGVPEKVPLLDQPLQISGARERKQVQRLEIKEDHKIDVKKQIDIPDGSGKPLGEIPRVQFHLNKLKSDDLKVLHRVLYSRIGQSHSIKKNIQQFKGFEFDKESSEYTKKLNIISKLKNPELKTLCTILDLTKTGKHADLAEKILNFLVLPEDSGKEPPEARPKRKGATSKSYKEAKSEGKSEVKSGDDDDHHDDDDDEEEEEEDAPKKKKSKKTPKANKKDESDKEDVEEEEEDVKVEVKSEDDEKDDSEEEEEENAISEEEEEKKPKKGKKAPPKKAANSTAANKGKKKGVAKEANKKGTATKKGAATKENNKLTKEPKSESDSENHSEPEDEEDDSPKEPPTKKSKAPPSDEDIETSVKKILQGADLEEITMKTVCKRVYEEYPDFDLGHKKEFIKDYVKSLIAS